MQNFSGKIGKNYKYTTLLLVLIVIMVVSAGFLWLFQSSSGKEAKKETYTLSKDSEGVKKTNKLLADLLLIEDSTVREIRNVNDLNRRYKALTFDLPFADDIEFGSSSFVHTSDIRLTDIDPSMITDEKDRDHFYNSKLQSLLEKQKSDNSINFFKIRFKKEDGQIRIKDIKLITSLFQVHFDKKIWKGSIVATDYGLFPENDFCFLSWGKNILPIKHCSETGEQRYYNADLLRNKFLRNNKNLSLIELSMENYNTDLELIGLHINDNQTQLGTLYIKYLDNQTISVKTSTNLKCVFYAMGNGPSYINPTSPGGEFAMVDFSMDLKAVFYDQSDNKITEMMLTHKNPIFTMSCPVRNNQGLSRYTIDPSLTDMFTQQVVRGACGMLTENNIDTTVQLTLDPYLSKWLEGEIKNYTDHLRRSFQAERIGRADDRWEMSVTVVDMRTGAILAMPFYRTEDDRLPMEVAMNRKNPALTRRYVGSTFKPLLTLAAVQTEPELLNLNTINPHRYSMTPDSICYMFGHRVKFWGGKSQWNGCESIEKYLAVSCDVYPVAMTMLAMNRNRPALSLGDNDLFTTIGRDEYIRLKSESENNNISWDQMGLMKNLDLLYKLKSSEGENADKGDYYMEKYVWENIPGWDSLAEDQTHYVDIISPDATVMRYDEFNNNQTTIRGNLVPWVLGQGNNSWNCLKLAEAWCRMLTKREMNVTITTPHGAEPKLISLANSTDNQDGIWDSFLEKLKTAQQIHTNDRLLLPMYEEVTNLNNRYNLTGDNALVLFSKTGTPSNYDWQEYLNVKNTKLRYDVGLYCMGLMTNGAYGRVKNCELGDGIMCVIRISRITTLKEKTGQEGLWSHHARDFFSANPTRLQRFYWLTKSHFENSRP